MSPGRARIAVLALMTAVGVVGVGWQRARSPFLRIAARDAAVARIADALGLGHEEVCAGWYELGAERTEAEVFAALGRFGPLRQGLGEGPAVVALSDLDAVVRARAAVGADDEALWARLATPPRRHALARFRAVRARFAAFSGGDGEARRGSER